VTVTMTDGRTPATTTGERDAPDGPRVVHPVHGFGLARTRGRTDGRTDGRERGSERFGPSAGGGRGLSGASLRRRHGEKRRDVGETLGT